MRVSRTSQTGKRASITVLYKDFEKAHAAAQAIPSPKPPSISSKEFDRATVKCGRIAERIVTAHANNIDEMLLKIRVAGWCAGAPFTHKLERLSDWKPDGKLLRGEEFDTLVSLRDDLQTLQTAHLRSIAELNECLYEAAVRGTSGERADVRLLQLGKQLETAWAHQRQLEHDASEAELAEFDKAFNRVSRIAKKIEALPAHSLAGLKVKARAIRWCHSGEKRIELARQPTTDIRLAQSIIRDLLAPAAG